MNPKLDTFEQAALIARYLKEELSDKELVLFEDWLSENPENEKLLDSFKDSNSVQRDIDFFASVDVDAGFQNVVSQLPGSDVKKKSWLPFLLWPASAAAVLLICLSVYKWKLKEAQIKSEVQASHVHKAIKPGSDKAQLILADGSSVLLDDKNSLGLKEQDGTDILIKSGQLVYKNNAVENSQILMNQLSTPKGGKYEMVLPDGSKVWLNALASLRFPTHFSGNERVVDLTGEAYFEVSRDKSKPFRVNVNGSTVEVLGTRFNINAYGNSVKTTLEEGAVKISLDENEKIIKPGEQAIVSDKRIAVINGNVEKAIAWKEGIFYFEEDGIVEVMDQVSRWYDVEVSYKGRVPQKRLSGNIRRQANLSQVLQMLELVSDAEFETAGRKIIVNFKN